MTSPISNGLMRITCKHRAQGDKRRQPMSIYEVHLGSWRRKDGNEFLTYDDLADQLVSYVKDMGFTHIELLPVSEHPYDPAGAISPPGCLRPPRGLVIRQALPALWMQPMPQASALFSIGCQPISRPINMASAILTARHFMNMQTRARAFIRIGIRRSTISAAREVLSFLLNNALFWLKQYHVDGLRVDAVASMLYLDYSRKEGEWIPNKHGGTRKSRGHFIPAAHEPRNLWPASRHRDHRRRNHGISRRVQANVNERAGLRLQMEHGFHA